MANKNQQRVAALRAKSIAAARQLKEGAGSISAAKSAAEEYQKATLPAGTSGGASIDTICPKGGRI